MEYFNEYSHALAALGGYAILMFVLTAVNAFGAPAAGHCGCGLPTRDYADGGYRRVRAHLNSVEAAGPFIAALMAAMLTGGAPFWVNLFASLFLLARIATAAVHIGTTNQALRSGAWFLSVICMLALAVIGVIGAF